MTSIFFYLTIEKKYLFEIDEIEIVSEETF